LGIEGNVTFTGYQSQQQVRELLGRTDVFVMASFAEGVPVVLMEAMAARVPVVATQIAGIPELVDDGVSGFLVPPGDPIALAEKVDRLLRDGNLRREFGRAGSEKVTRDFNLLTEAEKLCQILTTAVAGPSAVAFSSEKAAPAGTSRALGAA
jgi:glycosyltransferase involved in cell wall biosynthesis